MTTDHVKVGRNEPCPCGSGKKYKRCCGAVEIGAEDTASRFFVVASVLAVLMLIGGALVFAKAFFSDEGRSGMRVSSAGQGRYRAAALPLEGSTPVPGALQGLRASERDAARGKVTPSQTAN